VIGNPRIIEPGTEIIAIQELTCPHNSFYVPQGAVGVTERRVEGSLSFRVKFPPNDKHKNAWAIMVTEDVHVKVGQSPSEKRIAELERLLDRASTTMSNLLLDPARQYDQALYEALIPLVADISFAVKTRQGGAS
jgi:hypothetical protein